MITSEKVIWSNSTRRSTQSLSLMRVLFTGCALVSGQSESFLQKEKKMHNVNFSRDFSSDQVWVHLSNVFTGGKTANQINPAATASVSFQGLFTSLLFLPFHFLCYHLLCLFLSCLCVCPCRSRVALCASLPKHRWHSGRLQEKANEVSWQSKIWLIIWPLQQGTAEKDNDHCTCQLLIS